MHGRFTPQGGRHSSMQVRYILWTSILLAAALVILTACQPTPEENAVLGKDEERFESLVQKTEENADKKDTVEADNESEKVIYKSYSRVDQFVGADPDVNISVDVSGRYQSNMLPVIKVSPKKFSMDELRKWATVLSSSDKYTEPKHTSTKAEIETRILDLKRYISDDEALRSEFNNDVEAKEEYIAEISESIKMLEALYDTAPEKDSTTDTDWAFHDRQYYTEDTMVVDYSEDGMDEDEQFIVDFPSSLGSGRLSYLFCRKDGYYNVSLYYQAYTSVGDFGLTKWDTNLEKPLTLTEDEAIEKASDLLSKLGMQDYRCVVLRKYGASINGDNMKRPYLEGEDLPQQAYLYNLVYRRSFNGVDLLPAVGINTANISEYGARYEHEQLNIWIVNDEIHTINWVAPLAVESVENKDVKTIGFDKAYDLFAKQMQIEYTKGKLSRYSPENIDYAQEIARIKGGEIHVDDVLLGMVRVQIPDNYDEFRLVPAWSFRGREMLDYGDGCDWENGYSFAAIYQTINAVDGTYIDVYKGY